MLEIPSLTGTNKRLLYMMVKRDAPASSGISSSQSKGIGAQCADSDSYIWKMFNTLQFFFFWTLEEFRL